METSPLQVEGEVKVLQVTEGKRGSRGRLGKGKSGIGKGKRRGLWVGCSGKRGAKGSEKEID